MINVIRDGETYNHKELVEILNFKNEETLQKWISRQRIHAAKVNGIWWMAGEDIRRGMRMGTAPKPDTED